MNKKQVFRKLFQNDKEYVEKLLKDAEENKATKKDRGRNFLHKFLRIHSYVVQKHSNNFECGKCRLCPETFKVKNRDSRLQNITKFIMAFFGAIIGVIIASGTLEGHVFILVVAMTLIGLCLTFHFTRILIEDFLWEDY